MCPRCNTVSNLRRCLTLCPTYLAENRANVFEPESDDYRPHRRTWQGTWQECSDIVVIFYVISDKNEHDMWRSRWAGDWLRCLTSYSTKPAAECDRCFRSSV